MELQNEAEVQLRQQRQPGKNPQQLRPSQAQKDPPNKIGNCPGTILSLLSCAMQPVKNGLQTSASPQQVLLARSFGCQSSDVRADDGKRHAKMLKIDLIEARPLDGDPRFPLRVAAIPEDLP